MAIPDLLAVISQTYPTPVAAAPEAGNRDLVDQKSNARPTLPRARCLAGFDWEYKQWYLGARRSVTGITFLIMP
ncbi:unnamed protein product [Schistocephalus solidus]|uniref:Transposase n=1 Tax=Schistocephalus solidus TaxID=70667 RepID=A0A183TTA8_SCHSO|nr:unnamed protein product [Schistocephalus solidus]